MSQDVISNNYSKRVEDLKLRQAVFEEQNKRLKIFFTNFKLKCEEIIINDEKDLNNYDYQLKSREEYSLVSHLNDTFYSHLHRSARISKKAKCYCRILMLDRMPESLQNHFLKESFKIMKFFSSEDHQNKQKLYEIFRKGTNYYIFLEHFELSSSLMHIVWNKIEISEQIIKHWIIDLNEAVESLNVCGVAHRFIRAENVLLTKHLRIRLTAFDVACVYYDIDQEKIIPQKRILPIECDNFLLDHLPPECFKNNYDASNVDVWSIGTLVCLLATRNNPFMVGDENYFKRWRYCWERRTLSEELRTLLDDIFQDADHRITVFDLKFDRRLLQTDSTTLKTKNNYYRIDLRKNTDLVGIKRSDSLILSANPDFAPNTRNIYMSHCCEIISNEETLRAKNFLIERNKSFGEEFNIFINDHYLESRDNNLNKSLAKVFILKQIPIRHKNLLLNESGKIIKYFSQNNKTVRNYIHQVIEMFLSEDKLFIFYERILHCRSIYYLFNDQDESIRPSSIHIKQWMIQLIEVIDNLSNHAISHRYIRPEYVFIENYNTIKLTHFDMACFVWNPISKIPTMRHRGLQDEREHLWNHLPPECFNDKYDSLLVDIWSFGVLLLFCLVQKNPFHTPHNEKNALQVWSEFRQSNQNQLFEYAAILNRIFVKAESRIRINELKKRFLTQDSNIGSMKSITGAKSRRQKIDNSSSTSFVCNQTSETFTQQCSEKRSRTEVKKFKSLTNIRDKSKMGTNESKIHKNR